MIEQRRSKEFSTHSRLMVRFATWMDKVAESANDRTLPLTHNLVWAGMGVAALAGIRAITNMATAGNIDMTGLTAVGHWLENHGYRGEFMHVGSDTYGLASQAGENLTEGSTRISSLKDIAQQIAMDPAGKNLLIENIAATPSELRLKSLWEISKQDPDLAQNWEYLSQYLSQELQTLSKLESFAGLSKVAVALIGVGSISLALLKHKGSEPISLSAPIMTPFGQIPGVADTVRHLCQKVIPPKNAVDPLV